MTVDLGLARQFPQQSMCGERHFQWCVWRFGHDIAMIEADHGCLHSLRVQDTLHVPCPGAGVFSKMWVTGNGMRGRQGVGNTTGVAFGNTST
mmetsp:Transcript_103209/g.301023  ORF Transcript_103209/g.301023 Transcript_103209/m.301023 type:complete len:92 (-) Transcript_103209:175-450(-)